MSLRSVCMRGHLSRQNCIRRHFGSGLDTVWTCFNMAAKFPDKPTTDAGEGPSMPLTHNVPPPISFEKSKLDWLLAINEQYFEAELRTVVTIL